MAVIKWRDSYNTGVGQFDREHHKLIELIELLHGAVRDKSGKEVAEKACDELVSYTVVHFDNEEKAMAAVGYPELEAHREKHSLLRQEAQNFQKRIAGNFPDGVLDLYRFLREWLINHILDCDKKYGPFLKEMREISSVPSHQTAEK